MNIRRATEQDWPRIYPFYAAIMAQGETYPFPEQQTLEEARPWWMEQPPGQTVVAVDDGVVVGSAKMGPNRPAADRTWRPRRSWSIRPARARAQAAPSGSTSWTGAARRALRASSSTPSSRPTPPPCICGSHWGSRSSARYPRPSTIPSTVWSACTSCAAACEAGERRPRRAHDRERRQHLRDASRVRVLCRPRTMQLLRRGQHNRDAPSARDPHQQPRAPGLAGAAEPVGTPRRDRSGPQFPDPFRGDGLGNHRMHDVLLACGPPCSGRCHRHCRQGVRQFRECGAGQARSGGSGGAGDRPRSRSRRSCLRSMP